MSKIKIYQIEIQGLNLYGYHGVFLEENKLGQMFQIDLSLKVRQSDDQGTDHPKSVVSYADIVDQVHQTFSSESFKLIESLAEKILKDLARFPSILFSKIHVKKLHPPIPHTLHNVGVIFETSY